MLLPRRLTRFLWAALALGCGRSELLAPGFASASGQSSSSTEVSSSSEAGAPAARVQSDGGDVREGGVSCGTGSCAVLFGGWNNSALADTWVWDGSRWTEQSVPGPSARSEAVMANLNGKPVLFGGAGAYPAGYLADTWVWDGVWTKLDVTGPPVG